MRVLLLKIGVLILFFPFQIYSQSSLQKELNQSTRLDTISVKNILVKADSLVKTNQYKDAELQYRFAIDKAIKIKNTTLLQSSIKKLVKLFSSELLEYQRATEAIDFLYEYCKELNDQSCLINALIQNGKLSQKKGQFINALKHYNEALQKLEYSENIALHWEALTYRGMLLLDIGDSYQSKVDFKNSLHYVHGKNKENREGLAYVNISGSFSNDQHDSIIYYSRLAVRNCEGNKTSRRCNLAYNNMAWSYFLKGLPAEALEIIKTNIDLDNLEYSDIDSLYPALMHTLGSIYYALGDYKNALKHHKIAHKYYVISKDIASTVVVKEDLSKVYEKLGNLSAGIRVLREIKPLTSTLDSLKVIKEIARLESKKILTLKEEKISNLEEENIKIGKSVGKVKVVSYVLIFILIATLFVFLYRGYQNKIKFYKLNEELSVNRLKSLRLMMNPHFLFNSFSTLQNYILKNNNKAANEYMTELSDLIRNVLASSDSIYIPFKEELEILKSYIKIEKERFDNSFEVYYKIDETLVHMNPKLPSMIIQPYIENAIIHGFSHSDKKGILTLSFQKKLNNLECKIVDNGVGRDEAARLQKIGNTKAHLSIATRNTDERLRIIGKIGNKNANVIINDLFDSKNNAVGTEVVIILPILKQNL